MSDSVSSAPIRVQAATFKGNSGNKLEVETLNLAAPQHGEVRVKVKAAGICGSDRHVIDGEWSVALPAVMGHEAAGIVDAVGPGVHSLAEGDHVVVAWHQGCQRCSECTSGKPWACGYAKSNDSLLPDGTSRWTNEEGDTYYPYLAVGAMSEAIVIPDFAAIKISEQVPFDVASLIGCSVGTGYGAVVNNAQITPGESAVVIGAGGVGIALIQALKLAGANPIIAVDVSDSKLEEAHVAGATHTLLSDATLPEKIRHIVPGGVHAAFEAIGKPQTMELLPELLRLGGRAIFVGLPPENTSVNIDALQLAYDGKTIVGSNYGGLIPARDFPRIADAYLAGKLPLESLISARIPLAEVNEAFDAMREGTRTRSIIEFS